MSMSCLPLLAPGRPVSRNNKQAKKYNQALAYNWGWGLVAVKKVVALQVLGVYNNNDKNNNSK